jgi:hypothetical protein
MALINDREARLQCVGGLQSLKRTRMRAALRTSLCSLLFLACLAFARAQGGGAPLPDGRELLKRAIDNEKKLDAQRERYACRLNDEALETDSKGNVKKTTTEVKEQFFVNGIAVERTLAKNGKELTPEETRKEDEHVMKKAVKYSNQTNAKKETDKQNQQIEDVLTAMQLANGRRGRENGRAILFYDIVPNPKFQAKNLNQRFAQVMDGKVSLDEQTGEMIDLNIRSVQDLKIAGGVLANLHKGFWLHVHNHAQADGVWITDLAEGSGDARAALFFHPYFRFKESTGECHLYNAEANQAGQASVVK